MISKKKLKLMAKTMLVESTTNGYVDPAKVKKVLENFMSKKLSGTTSVLKHYKRLIESLVSKEKVTIETSVPHLLNQETEKILLLKTGARKIEYKINPKVVFGSKITYGDWIIENTLDAKLKQLI